MTEKIRSSMLLDLCFWSVGWLVGKSASSRKALSTTEETLIRQGIRSNSLPRKVSKNNI